MRRIWYAGEFSLVFILICIFFLSCGKQKQETGQEYLRLMPADTFLYLGFKDWKVLRDETGAFDFIRTARRLKIGPRIRKMLAAKSDTPAPARRAAKRLEALRTRISLWDLLGGEIALGAFPGEEKEAPVLALLCRLPAKKAQLYTDYFRELVSVAGFSPEELNESETDYLGETLTSFSLPEIPGRITWCRAGDIFILSSAIEGARAILSRLKGEGGGATLADEPAFRKSFEELNPAAKGVYYLKVKALTGFVEEALEENYAKAIPPALSEPGDITEARYYLRGLMRAVNTIETIAGTSDLTPEGYREESRLYLNEENGSRAVLDLLRTEARDWDVLDYIPEGVADLSAGYLSPEKLYRPLLDFITGDPVRGKKLSILWKEFQKNADLDPEKDLFSWMGDEYAVSTVSLSRSFFEPGSFALFWKVTSRKDLDIFLDKLLSLGMKRSLNIVMEEYGGCTMRTVYLPVPLSPFNPTIGQVGEYLVLASRRDTFENIVDTFLKDKKSVRQNPDFIRMRKRIGNRGTGIDFSRLEDKIESAVTFIRSSSSMMGMLMATVSSPDEEMVPPTSPDPQEVIALLNDITKVMEDWKVFKFRGEVSRYREGCIEVNDFVKIGEEKK